jgi:hypothetical protein
MLSKFPSLRVCTIALALAVSLCPTLARAQDDPPSLGDLARTLRQNKSQQQTKQSSNSASASTNGSSSTVIDNDNLIQVMDDAKNARPVKETKTVFSIDPVSNTLKVSSPDVTCSMSFNARASSLLIKPVLIEDLPLIDLLKLDGPGSIQDQNLELEVFNGTDWDLREITIGLTLERKPGENAEAAASARIIPAAEGLAPTTIERRSDVTLLYHLKADAKPFSTTAFHENIGITPGPDEDWRWSIVEAKGIRPSQATAPPDSLQEPMFASPSSLVPESKAPQLPPISPAMPVQPSLDKPTSAASPQQ